MVISGGFNYFMLPKFYVIFRILKELQAIQASKPHGIEVSVPSDNIYIWEAKFAAPDQSLYKGANLRVQIVLSYPFC